MPPMRIAHVVPCYWPAIEFGGPVQSVANLARGQRDLGHDVVVLTTNMRGVAGERAMAPGWHDVEGVRVFYAAVRRPKGYFTSPGFVAQMWRTLRNGVDVVHVHGMWVFTTLAASRLCEWSGVPYLVAPRGMLNRWALEQQPWKKRAYLALLESHTLRRAAAVHFTSDAERDEFDGSVDHVVVPNAIRLDGLLDIAPLDRARLGPDGLHLLIAGRIHPVKGFDLLIPALASVRARGCDVRLTVAGGDEGGYRAHVSALVAQHGVDDVVTFTGRLERAALHAEFARATALIVPSHQESFGMSAAEAMAAARPVVVSERVNICTEVAAAGAGLVAPHSVDGLAQTVLALGRCRDLPEIGLAGRQHVVRTYSPTAVAATMVEAYRRIIGRPGPRATGPLSALA
jgi:glycosyltransferase involved in cell wall biosynthesis